MKITIIETDPEVNLRIAQYLIGNGIAVKYSEPELIEFASTPKRSKKTDNKMETK